jgi:penicillin-binding protein-related factor A (putative recombinase)
MFNENRVKGGIRANQSGAAFEDIFSRICRMQGISVTRIPNGCRRVGPGPRDIVQIKSPFDWILTYMGRTAVIDTKTVNARAFNSGLIKNHQVKELYAHESAGAKGGYVIWLRESNKVFYLGAKVLTRFQITGGMFNEQHPEAVYLGDTFNFDVRKVF